MVEDEEQQQHSSSAEELETLSIFVLILFTFSAIFHLLFKRYEKNHEFLAKCFDISVWSSLWYAFSISLVIYNKWLVSSWEGGFKYPLIMSANHMVLKLLLVVLISKTNSKIEIPNLPNSIYWYHAVPIGITTALDIAASNEAILFVSVPFYTVVKSSSLLFVLFFSILFNLQPKDPELFIVAIIISIGIALAVFAEFAFSLPGFILILAASALGGFRWSLTQLFMNHLKGKLDSLLTIYFISPAAAITLLPVAIFFEGSEFFSSKFLHESSLLFLMIINLIGSGLFAFAMIFVELRLIKRTSSLTMAVISYVKQFMQIILSSIVFKARLSVLNLFGLCITILGTFYYTRMKLRETENKKNSLIYQDIDELSEFSNDTQEDQLLKT